MLLSIHGFFPPIPLLGSHCSIYLLFHQKKKKKIYPSRFLVPVQVPRAYFLTLFEGRVVQPYRCQPPLHPHVDLLFFSAGGGGGGHSAEHALTLDRPSGVHAQLDHVRRSEQRNIPRVPRPYASCQRKLRRFARFALWIFAIRPTSSAFERFALQSFFFFLITQDYHGSTSTNLVQKAVVYSHARIHVAMIYPMDERKWREGKEWDSGLSLARFGSWWPEDLVWIAFASESRDNLATYTKFECWLKFPRSEPWRSYTQSLLVVVSLVVRFVWRWSWCWRKSLKFGRLNPRISTNLRYRPCWKTSNRCSTTNWGNDDCTPNSFTLIRILAVRLKLRLTSTCARSLMT